MLIPLVDRGVRSCQCLCFCRGIKAAIFEDGLPHRLPEGLHLLRLDFVSRGGGVEDAAVLGSLVKTGIHFIDIFNLNVQEHRLKQNGQNLAKNQRDIKREGKGGRQAGAVARKIEESGQGAL